MATSKEYADFIMSKFSRLEVVTIKPMMGEYVIHMAGKVLGFLGDEQMMFEPGPTIDRLLPDAEKRELFPGSKLFPIIPDGMAPGEVCAIAEAIYDDLPISKPRKPRAPKKSSAPSSSGRSSKAASGSPASGSPASGSPASGSSASGSESASPSAPDPFPFAKHIDW